MLGWSYSFSSATICHAVSARGSNSRSRPKISRWCHEWTTTRLFRSANIYTHIYTHDTLRQRTGRFMTFAACTGTSCELHAYTSIPCRITTTTVDDMSKSLHLSLGSWRQSRRYSWNGTRSISKHGELAHSWPPL